MFKNYKLPWKETAIDPRNEALRVNSQNVSSENQQFRKNVYD